VVSQAAIELTRLEVQDRLDSAKTQAERNRLGQFATPTGLATDILQYAKSLLVQPYKIRFLDPAFGTGSFYSALIRAFSPLEIVRAVGYEIDPHYGNEAKKIWSDNRLVLHLADFTRAAPPTSDEEKFNLLICNPPYVRHHHLNSADKTRLQRAMEQITGLRLSGLAGLYCYFIALSHGWMAENGLAGWLIPSEFMDVNYGQEIKEYLLDRVTLLRIHRFNPDDVQFGDALVSSAVVWFRMAEPPHEHSVEFTYGGTLTEPEVVKHISTEVLRKSAKWSKFPLASSSVRHHVKQLQLSDLFTIKRGLATGANSFFILTPERIAQFQLPREFMTPILPSPRFLPVNEIEADSTGNPLIDRRLFLLSCNLPEGVVKSRYPALWKYLQTGVKAGLDQRYLSKHRSPWYAQEERPASMFLCTYMGRRDIRNSNPFRFILNHSKATAPNVYLMLYPRSSLKEQFRLDPNLPKLVWQALNEITPEVLVSEGRVYGGGLHKMEPNELGNASADNILRLLPDGFTEQNEQMILFGE